MPSPYRIPLDTGTAGKNSSLELHNKEDLLSSNLVTAKLMLDGRNVDDM